MLRRYDVEDILVATFFRVIGTLTAIVRSLQSNYVWTRADRINAVQLAIRCFYSSLQEFRVWRLITRDHWARNRL